MGMGAGMGATCVIVRLETGTAGCSAGPDGRGGMGATGAGGGGGGTAGTRDRDGRAATVGGGGGTRGADRGAWTAGAGAWGFFVGGSGGSALWAMRPCCTGR